MQNNTKIYVSNIRKGFSGVQLSTTKNKETSLWMQLLFYSTSQCHVCHINTYKYFVSDTHPERELSILEAPVKRLFVSFLSRFTNMCPMQKTGPL